MMKMISAFSAVIFVYFTAHYAVDDINPPRGYLYKST